MIAKRDTSPFFKGGDMIAKRDTSPFFKGRVRGISTGIKGVR